MRRNCQDWCSPKSDQQYETLGIEICIISYMKQKKKKYKTLVAHDWSDLAAAAAAAIKVSII